MIKNFFGVIFSKRKYRAFSSTFIFHDTEDSWGFKKVYYFLAVSLYSNKIKFPRISVKLLQIPVFQFPPKSSGIPAGTSKSNFITYILSNFKTSENVQTTDHGPHPPRHVLAISNGIVNVPEYISTNSHFQLEKNKIVIEY